MTFDWEEYYALAVRLRQEKDEAAQRSAISRVYYSVFCQARNYLQEEGFQISSMGPGSHRQVWVTFLNQGRTLRGISAKGERLHRNRIKADYLDEIAGLNSLVKDSFEVADIILHYLAQARNARHDLN